MGIIKRLVYVTKVRSMTSQFVQKSVFITIVISIVHCSLNFIVSLTFISNFAYTAHNLNHSERKY